MSPLSRRTFLGSLAAIPAAAFMPTHDGYVTPIYESDSPLAPISGFAPIDDSQVLVVREDGRLITVRLSTTDSIFVDGGAFNPTPR